MASCHHISWPMCDFHTLRGSRFIVLLFPTPSTQDEGEPLSVVPPHLSPGTQWGCGGATHARVHTHTHTHTHNCEVLAQGPCQFVHCCSLEPGVGAQLTLVK